MSLFMLICRKICFAAIYAVLAQNLFCCDLRTFVWRKIYSEIVRVEKKGQISGMTKTDLTSMTQPRSAHACGVYQDADNQLVGKRFYSCKKCIVQMINHILGIQEI